MPPAVPLTDLEASDFVVSIDGQPRRVLTARMFGTDEVQVAKAGTPVPRFTRASDATPGRVIMFAVDRDSIRSGSEKAILKQRIGDDVVVLSGRCRRRDRACRWVESIRPAIIPPRPLPSAS